MILISALTLFLLPVALVLIIIQQRKRKEALLEYEKIIDKDLSIQEKMTRIDELEKMIEQKDQIMESIKAAAREDSKKEREEILHAARKEAEKANENLLDEINEKDVQLAERETAIRERESSIEAEKESIILQATEKRDTILEGISKEFYDVTSKVEEKNRIVSELEAEIDKLTKEENRLKRNARKYRADLMGMQNFNHRIDEFLRVEDLETELKKIVEEIDQNELLKTVSELHLHSNNSKELRKLSTATKKEIKNLLQDYESKYTTKANKTIYGLLVIALQAEAQIIMYNLKYDKLSEAKENIKSIINKYLLVCGEGNQSILPTLTRFLTEIEPLYLELIEIEYKYYVRREQEKEEQRLIREQIKQEAAERKALEQERKKLEAEENKFINEMERNKLLLKEEVDEDKISVLLSRITELESQMNEIEEKKETITNLANGKAGYVYVISNKGSFGEKVFKIGMTRRMVPQDRVDELGSASVPFKFDVHALIFSDDAVGLESTLHKKLDRQRVNKMNFRKEFFYSTVDRLEQLVEEIDPTAEFEKTMLAEEYNQTLALEEEKERPSEKELVNV